MEEFICQRRHFSLVAKTLTKQKPKWLKRFGLMAAVFPVMANVDFVIDFWLEERGPQISTALRLFTVENEKKLSKCVKRKERRIKLKTRTAK